MAREHDMHTEALARGAEPGRGYEVARLLSSVFHPILLSIATFLIVGSSGVAGPTGLLWAALGIALQVLPGVLFYTVRKRQGAYSDEDVSVRQQRNELYLFSMVVLVAGGLVLWLAGAPQAFLALMVSACTLNMLYWLINLFWKISVHAGTSASCATIALLLIPPLGVALWLCTLLVGWARVRTRNHTPAQVVAGWLVAASCTAVIFRAFSIV